MYQDVDWEVFHYLPPSMKEYVTYYDGRNLPYEFAINVAKKNMIQFSKLAKLDHYKKCMMNNLSSNIAVANEQHIATVFSTRGIRSKASNVKLSKFDLTYGSTR